MPKNVQEWADETILRLKKELDIAKDHLKVLHDKLQNTYIERDKAREEVTKWCKVTGRDDPEALDFELGRAGIDVHLRVLSAEIEKLKSKLKDPKHSLRAAIESLDNCWCDGTGCNGCAR